MSQTLPHAREAFIAHMSRGTTLSERPRLVAILDAMIEWSAARPDRVRFRGDDNTRGVVRFESVASRAIIWSATPRTRDFPVLELLPSAARVLSPEERASALATLDAHTRSTLAPDGRLHIGFGALKNANAKQAVLDLVGDLLEKVDEAARPATR